MMIHDPNIPRKKWIDHDPYLIFPEKIGPNHLCGLSAAFGELFNQEEKRRQRSHGEHLWVVGKHRFFVGVFWVCRSETRTGSRRLNG